MQASLFSWHGKGKDGPTGVTLGIYGVTDKLVVLMTAWSSPTGDKANGAELPDLPAYWAAIGRLAARGDTVVDHCRGTLAVQPGESVGRWAGILRDLPEWLTHLALHWTAPGDFQPLSAQHAPWRNAEYELFASGAFERLLAAEAIATLGTRALQALSMEGGVRRHAAT